MDKGLCIRDGVNHPKIENRVQAHQQNEAELIQKRQCMQKKMVNSHMFGNTVFKCKG